jgi:hypothetical protein
LRGQENEAFDGINLPKNTPSILLLFKCDDSETLKEKLNE